MVIIFVGENEEVIGLFNSPSSARKGKTGSDGCNFSTSAMCGDIVVVCEKTKECTTTGFKTTGLKTVLGQVFDINNADIRATGVGNDECEGEDEGEYGISKIEAFAGNKPSACKINII